jgi:transcription antitermination factor NusG
MASQVEDLRGSAAATLPECADGRWWVAHTRPRAEKALAADLTRIRIPHYLPLCQRVTRSRATNRISRSTVPVFTGYLFFVATEEQRLAAFRTNRIVSILNVPNQAGLVAELRQIQRVLGADAPFARNPRVQVGRWVRIMAGPLTGVEGVVTHLRAPLRLFLNVDILGQSISVETSPDMVEPIDSPA